MSDDDSDDVGHTQNPAKLLLYTIGALCLLDGVVDIRVRIGFRVPLSSISFGSAAVVFAFGVTGIWRDSEDSIFSDGWRRLHGASWQSL
jgi:hypothetical protein